MERLEGEHAGKVESRAVFQGKQARERLIELAKSQDGWKRARVLPDMEVRLFGRICWSCCFLRRWYPRELICTNVDTGLVIHVDQCSETIASAIHLPLCPANTAHTEHTGEKRICYLITCLSIHLQLRLWSVSAILLTNASCLLALNFSLHIHCKAQAPQTPLDSVSFFP